MLETSTHGTSRETNKSRKKCPAVFPIPRAAVFNLAVMSWFRGQHPPTKLLSTYLLVVLSVFGSVKQVLVEKETYCNRAMGRMRQSCISCTAHNDWYSESSDGTLIIQGSIHFTNLGCWLSLLPLVWRQKYTAKDGDEH